MHKQALYHERRCKDLGYELKGARKLNAKYVTMCEAFQAKNKALVSNCEAQGAIYTENEANLQKEVEKRDCTIAWYEKKCQAMVDCEAATISGLKSEFQRTVCDKNAKIAMLHTQLHKLQAQSQDINPNIPYRHQKVGFVVMC